MLFDAYARRQAQVLFDAFADRLVKDLSSAAKEEASASAAQARREAQEAAEAELAAARADGEARLAAVQAMNAGLLESVEAAREEVRTTQAAAQEQMRTTQAAAQEDVRSTQAAAQAEIDRTRAELQARLDEQEQALHAARQEARVASKALEEARREAGFARVEADRCHQDRDVVVDRVGAALSAIDRATSPSDILDTLLEPLAADFTRAAVFLVSSSTLNGWRARGQDAPTDMAKLVMPRSGDSVMARAVAERKRLFVTATAGEPVVGLMGQPVARAAALPVLAGDQVIAVAYAEDADVSSPPSTPFPGAACKIVEMLIDHATLRLTTKRQPSSRPPAQTGQNGDRSAFAPQNAQPAVYSQARQARRLKVQEGIDVTMDGAESDLVDLSSIGAQILSPLALPPNRLVRMTLRTGDAALACKGRVMWAQFEQGRGKAAPRYRVGVKFTDIEPKAVEALLTRHGIAGAPR